MEIDYTDIQVGDIVRVEEKYGNIKEVYHVKVTSIRDGIFPIEGEYKYWNKATKRWEKPLPGIFPKTAIYKQLIKGYL